APPSPPRSAFANHRYEPYSFLFWFTLIFANFANHLRFAKNRSREQFEQYVSTTDLHSIREN
ncbi:MAG: hypothetical protein PV344_04200, partial [Anaplasma sp.]|nr:hypothetical protein [Anaplasma sp.]